MVVRLADRRSNGCQAVDVNAFLVFNDVFEREHVKLALHLGRDYVTFEPRLSGITRCR